MQQVSFEIWWNEFLDQFPDRWTSGSEEVDGLVNSLAHFDPTKREAALDELTGIVLSKGRAWWIAAYALCDIGTTHTRRLIVEHLRENGILSASGILTQEFIGNSEYKTEFHRAQDRHWAILLLRILAAENSDEFISLLVQYLDGPRAENEYDGICWALWKSHPQLAVKGWVRFFASDPSRPTSRSLVVQRFQLELEALRALKAALVQRPDETWRLFRKTILSPDLMGWLNEHQREQLRAIVD